MSLQIWCAEVFGTLQITILCHTSRPAHVASCATRQRGCSLRAGAQFQRPSVSRERSHAEALRLSLQRDRAGSLGPGEEVGAAHLPSPPPPLPPPPSVREPEEAARRRAAKMSAVMRGHPAAPCWWGWPPPPPPSANSPSQSRSSGQQPSQAPPAAATWVGCERAGGPAPLPSTPQQRLPTGNRQSNALLRESIFCCPACPHLKHGRAECERGAPLHERPPQCQGRVIGLCVCGAPPAMIEGGGGRVVEGGGGVRTWSSGSCKAMLVCSTATTAASCSRATSICPAATRQAGRCRAAALQAPAPGPLPLLTLAAPPGDPHPGCAVHPSCSTVGRPSYSTIGRPSCSTAGRPSCSRVGRPSCSTAVLSWRQSTRSMRASGRRWCPS